MVLKAQNFQFSTNVALAYNAYGLAKLGNCTHKSRLELLMFNNR